jgi:hypothetical protein
MVIFINIVYCFCVAHNLPQNLFAKLDAVYIPVVWSIKGKVVPVLN